MRGIFFLVQQWDGRFFKVQDTVDEVTDRCPVADAVIFAATTATTAAAATAAIAVVPVVPVVIDVVIAVVRTITTAVTIDDRRYC